MAVYWPIPVFGRFVLSEKGAYYATTRWGIYVIWLLKYVMGITYRVHGSENIPDKPCVVLSKHQSALDIFVLLTIFDPQSWVFKKELLRIPCFGWAIAATRPIAIDRNAGRKALQKLIDIGTDKLKKGFWVLLYPEGTRTQPGVRGKHKSGGVLLAKKAGADIVPVALNTGLFWQKGKGAINNGVVDIVVGKPISTDSKGIKEITAEVETWIEERALEITLDHPYYLQLQKNKT
ncbi:MAG: 1-acyl-sn-glycerol-3-phosphate acyltransferase [Gammaproteobacteria bacterium]|nr:1-acyl-sn-glycerol-3-phosphate acyltransferase [Gammaproteobacteria bacterium]